MTGWAASGRPGREAIREAGFEPNEMQGKVLSDEELLAHWAGAVPL